MFFLFFKVHQFLKLYHSAINLSTAMLLPEHNSSIENTTATIHSKQPPTANVYCSATDSIHLE